MLYSRLGNTGLIVSRLSLGTMTFTAGNKRVGTLARVDPAAAEALVGQEIDAGIISSTPPISIPAANPKCCSARRWVRVAGMW